MFMLHDAGRCPVAGGSRALDAALDPRLSAFSLCEEEKEQAGFNRPVRWPVCAHHVTF